MLDLPTPEEAPSAILGMARQMAAACVPVQMTATAEAMTPWLVLAALRLRSLDDHGEIFRLLQEVYATDPDDHETAAQFYELIAEDAERLAKNERDLIEDEPVAPFPSTYVTREGRAA